MADTTKKGLSEQTTFDAGAKASGMTMDKHGNKVKANKKTTVKKGGKSFEIC